MMYYVEGRLYSIYQVWNGRVYVLVLVGEGRNSGKRSKGGLYDGMMYVCGGRRNKIES